MGIMILEHVSAWSEKTKCVNYATYMLNRVILMGYMLPTFAVLILVMLGLS